MMPVSAMPNWASIETLRSGPAATGSVQNQRRKCRHGVFPIHEFPPVQSEKRDSRDYYPGNHHEPNSKGRFSSADQQKNTETA
jgi:hypothetical protein